MKKGHILYVTYNPPTSEPRRLPAWVHMVMDKLGKTPEFYIAILERLPDPTRKIIVQSFCSRCASRVFGLPCECKR